MFGEGCRHRRLCDVPGARGGRFLSHRSCFGVHTGLLCSQACAGGPSRSAAPASASRGRAGESLTIHDFKSSRLLRPLIRQALLPDGLAGGVGAGAGAPRHRGRISTHEPHLLRTHAAASRHRCRTARGGRLFRRRGAALRRQLRAAGHGAAREPAAVHTSLLSVDKPLVRRRCESTEA